MIRARINTDNRIEVDCPPTWNEVVKRIPGARYTGGIWTTPLTWPACLQLRDEFGENLVLDQSLIDWARNYLQHRQRVMDAKNGEFVAPGLDPRLRPGQALGATWLAWAGRAMLLDEMRAGKTPQMIEALEYVGEPAFPALLVCPSTNRWVWEGEFKEWGKDSGIIPIVLHGSAAQRRKQIEEAQVWIREGFNVVVITNWESLRNLSRLEGYGSVVLTEKEKTEGPLNEIQWGTVIADEAHRALDPKSKQTRALWYLMHSAPRRYVLTATAIANSGADLWSLWYAIAPEECPVRSKWVDRYCIAGPGRFGYEIAGLRPDRQPELFEALDPRMLRRTMREIRPGMPDKLPVEIRPQVLEGKQATTYAKLKKDMLVMLETAEGNEAVLVVPDPLVLAGRLTYAAAATPVLDDDGNVVSLTTPSVKVDALREVLDQYPGEPLVVFAASRKLIELCERELAKDGVRFVSIHGGVDPQLRAANIANFQHGEAQVVLCTSGAGAEGITLNRANRTLFLQRDWSMVKNVQAEARTDGLEGGQPIETIIHVVKGSIEERAIMKGEVKQGHLQELVRDHLRCDTL